MPAKKGASAIQKYFEDVIIDSLEEGRKKNAVLAIRCVILQDGNIPETTQLGTIGNMTKGDLRKKKDFVLSEFLTDMFIFAITKTDNMIDPQFTKSIGKTYYVNFDPMVDTIKLYEVAAPRASVLIPLTSKGKFNSVFIPVSSERLSVVSKAHDLQIFCLQFEDYDFDYSLLWKYLRNNIGYYVYSRADIDRYMDDEEIGSIAYDAIDYLKQMLGTGGIPGDELGELLLYIFLEQVLKAPKFMSKVELSGYGGVNVSESAGIHLLTSVSPVPLSQIVLGASMIEGDIQKAIDSAFDRAKTLESRKGKERRFVETKIFAEAFPDKISEQLESIILPSEAKSTKPTTAFGIFVGYTIADIDRTGRSPEDYQKDIIAQVQADIIANVPYIESKISKMGLDGYSLYIYLLPFRDADVDKKDIMNKLLQRGG